MKLYSWYYVMDKWLLKLIEKQRGEVLYVTAQAGFRLNIKEDSDWGEQSPGRVIIITRHAIMIWSKYFTFCLAVQPDAVIRKKMKK